MEKPTLVINSGKERLSFELVLNDHESYIFPVYSYNGELSRMAQSASSDKEIYRLYRGHCGNTEFYYNRPSNKFVYRDGIKHLKVDATKEHLAFIKEWVNEKNKRLEKEKEAISQDSSCILF